MFVLFLKSWWELLRYELYFDRKHFGRLYDRVKQCPVNGKQSGRSHPSLRLHVTHTRARGAIPVACSTGAFDDAEGQSKTTAENATGVTLGSTHSNDAYSLKHRPVLRIANSAGFDSAP